MKRILLLFVFLSAAIASGQNYYWVMLRDKGASTFDAATWFDSKAIARYAINGQDPNDISNYPVDESYRKKVNSIAEEEIGVSRWLNAVAVVASEEQAKTISQLQFVRSVLPIDGEMTAAEYNITDVDDQTHLDENATMRPAGQLMRMQGEKFIANGIDGSGIRIAVLDGGFPRVDKHPAFAHLRENGKIIDTWNFPNKKADVYGWNSHGTMTLSCIVGQFKGQQIGLATGAEVLLYRTEVALEPRKEEVWWIMGMERADQHGANIISSSLGYGKERYCTTDMDGTSLVAKAANMAARKGMLVCNSAGNEGAEKQWKTIITPADADSVLCVAGIVNSLYDYRHIYFSSYGPSADGRMKPNVSAYGTALAAARIMGKDTIIWVDGTSFSCPLVAGFAACALQSTPTLSAMQLKEAIERSCDLYPYFDYALGYGVPQAHFFTEKPATVAPTFTFQDERDSICIRIEHPKQKSVLFYNKQLPDGRLQHYASIEIECSSPLSIRFHKASLDSCVLNVWYDGYTNSHLLTTAEQIRWNDTVIPLAAAVSSDDHRAVHVMRMNRDITDNIPSALGIGGRKHTEFYLGLGTMIQTETDQIGLHGISWSRHIGLRRVYAIGKYYAWGFGFEWGRQSYRLNKTLNNNLDNQLAIVSSSDIKRKKIYHNDWSLELFQRICFVHGGIFGRGIFWDLGVYGSYSNFHYYIRQDKTAGNPGMAINYTNPSFEGRYFWNWGITTRLNYDVIGIYGRYRLTSYHIDHTFPNWIELPRLEVGLELNL